jgi:hydroxymethylglutaryl-CoA reductase
MERVSVTYSSRLPGFFQLPPQERAQRVADLVGLSDQEQALLAGTSSDDLARSDRMIENVIGTYVMPLAVATNMQVNGRDVLVPMAIEEPSVVAGLSYAARMAREGGGFAAMTDEPLMIGQIQVLDIPDLHAARLRILAARQRLLEHANAQDPVIVSLGGGARDVVVRLFESGPVPMLVVHLIYDARDAMGANTVNTAAEALTPLIEELSGGRVGLRILSNLADRRLARASCVVPKAILAQEGCSPDEGVSRILEAYAFAAADPYRAATHNKGVMNGIDAVVIATGNDWRAIEAGVHAYAAQSGTYRPITAWERNSDGDLVGTIEIPLAVGTVGGATRVHPMAQIALKIMGVQSARELAEVMAAVGLAQNLAALRALAMEGIQRGHMKLHARQVAISVGAEGDQVEQVAARLAAEGVVRPDRAEAILRELREA